MKRKTIQGVPRNRIVAIRLEVFNFDFICDIQSSTATLSCLILETIPGLGISKMWCDFFVLSVLPEILRFSFKFEFCSKKPKLSKFERNSSTLEQRVQKSQTTFWICQE